MTSLKIIVLLLFFPLITTGQKKSIDKLLNTYNAESISYISVQELKMKQDTYLLLDTRKKEEFEVSHLPNAIWVGENPDTKTLNKHLQSNKALVVYCTIGIRSEDFGEKLEKNTTQKIYNLYGGIFSWKDAGYELLDTNQKPTNRVHTFSKNWQDYLRTGIAVY